MAVIRSRSYMRDHPQDHMIDSHVHLDAEQYPDPSGPIKRALDAGVSAMVVPGVGPASNRKVIDLAHRFPGIVFPAIGFHPERFDLTDLDADAVLDMIARERGSICAVGEVGLPWYGEHASDANVEAAAKARLARFARIAVEMDLALILHAPHRANAPGQSDAGRNRRAVAVRRTVRRPDDGACFYQGDGCQHRASQMHDHRGNRHLDNRKRTRNIPIERLGF